MNTRTTRGKKHKLKGGLFKRLERLEDAFEGNAPVASQIDALVDSIKTHLDWMLNTHTGASLSSYYVGLDDFNGAQVSSSDMKKQISSNIKETIEKYEPRIENIDVVYIDNHSAPLSLSFHILGYVEFANKVEKIEFDLKFEKGKLCKVY
jgi:type VI secretion system protein